MPTSEALARTKKKYEDGKVEQLTIRVPKGKKAIIKKYAEEQGESVNSLINRLINIELEKK